MRFPISHPRPSNSFSFLVSPASFPIFFPFAFSLSKNYWTVRFFYSPVRREEGNRRACKKDATGPRFDFWGKGKGVRLVVPPFFKKMFDLVLPHRFFERKKNKFAKKKRRDVGLSRA